jgi:hypothetical protein
MAARNRLNGTPFTCANRNYRTDLSQGHSHGPGNALGSVIPRALYTDPTQSLWVEHVIGRREPGEQIFWLMWYDESGNPLIPLSGVFDRNGLARIASALADAP